MFVTIRTVCLYVLGLIIEAKDHAARVEARVNIIITPRGWKDEEEKMLIE
jgi:hypothetical protein